MQKRIPGKKVRPFTVYLPSNLDQWLRTSSKKQKRTLTQQTILVLELGRKAMGEVA